MTDINLQPIHETDWDYLIILDACRYDYFKEFYKNYESLKRGKLEKKKSRGSHTPEWLINTFPEDYKYTYVSANPYINSRMPLHEIKGDRKYLFTPSEKFNKVIDVWLTHWDEEKNTVPPNKMNEAVLDNKRKEKPILHYIQPHEPYLTSFDTNFEWDNKLKIQGKNQEKAERPSWFKILRKIGKKPFKKLSLEKQWKIKEFLGIEIHNNWYEDYKKCRIEERKKHYKETLKITLESIEKLINELEGKIVITADHGECFGEHGLYGHPQGEDVPTLREIPWLVVDKEKMRKRK